MRKVISVLFLGLILFSLSNCTRYGEEVIYLKTVSDNPKTFKANKEIGMYYYDFLKDNMSFQNQEEFEEFCHVTITSQNFPVAMQSTKNFECVEHESSFLLWNSQYFLNKACEIDSTDSKVLQALKDCNSIIEEVTN
ncbi:hypothetical protein [Parvicella tangerina]|uniref:Uncharacterized protein n=1 Tax=Parvicella tangerina TaxID=2829795 RepID=A0A916NR49_9FLAO|nr:hypothetical protein [Parvicella tangerina]CAG5080430.1 hypothetical protein CRYO30217_01308 [Parvicella tangerina]